MSQSLIYSNAEDYETVNVSYAIDRTPDYTQYTYIHTPTPLADQRLEEAIINNEDDGFYRRVLVPPFIMRFTDDYDETFNIDHIPTSVAYQRLEEAIINNESGVDRRIRVPPFIMRFTDDFIPFERPALTRNHVVVVEPFDVCDTTCCVCLEEKKHSQFAKLNCDHVFCNACVCKVTSTCRVRCPLCRADITRVAVQTNSELQQFDVVVEEDLQELHDVVNHTQHQQHSQQHQQQHSQQHQRQH